ncbi:MAG: hypothetical protein H7221_08000 [Flavobacterium sp.]|nr:hypothetical protein [Flavobacterium sp.]
MENSNDNTLSKSSIWALLIYFILSFYHFGNTMMVYFFDYASFPAIHENKTTVFQVFNDRMFFVYTIPSILMVVSSVYLYFKNPEIISKRIIAIATLLGIISVATTLIFINPIHVSLISNGMTSEIENHLLSIAFYFQLVPAIFQMILVFYMLNIYTSNTKYFGRWLFILVFASLFYSKGTGSIESYVNYPFWSVIGNTDWLAYRNSGSALRFFGTFLIPAFLPILLSIPLFWWRPKAFPRYFIAIYWLANIWIFVITAIYFVPKIQLPLNEAYSTIAIDNLRTYDFPLRGTVVGFMEILLAWMFIKIGTQRFKESQL